MHGQEQIKILDADALASHPEIKRVGYDVLIANPPFAVEGFLQTLNEEDKKNYQLIKAIGENSNTNNIECFFLERIHHLMKPSGVVGVIVPSSILSNTEAVHNQTREILLQFFDIVSIAETGEWDIWQDRHQYSGAVFEKKGKRAKTGSCRALPQSSRKLF